MIKNLTHILHQSVYGKIEGLVPCHGDLPSIGCLSLNVNLGPVDSGVFSLSLSVSLLFTSCISLNSFRIHWWKSDVESSKGNQIESIKKKKKGFADMNRTHVGHMHSAFSHVACVLFKFFQNFLHVFACLPLIVNNPKSYRYWATCIRWKLIDFQP